MQQLMNIVVLVLVFLFFVLHPKDFSPTDNNSYKCEVIHPWSLENEISQGRFYLLHYFQFNVFFFVLNLKK